MTTSNFPPSAVGWTGIAIGGSVILAVIFLILMYTVNGRFGTVNDVLNSIVGISSAALAWMWYAEFHARSPLMSQITFALAVVGAIFTIVGSFLIIFEIYRLCLGWVVHGSWQCFDRPVAGGVLLACSRTKISMRC